MKIGFIGGGNMASAIMGGILREELVSRFDITVADLEDRVSHKLGVAYTADNREVSGSADVLFLSVKPQIYPAVIAEIRDHLKEGQLIITIAPGKTLAWLREQFGRDLPIVRTMPNTPAMVGEGMTAACPNSFVTEEMLDTALRLLGSFSKVEIVPEHLMDVVTSVSGSSPAYVFMFIEAMADAAVADGMPRAQAYTFAAQAVLGSAKMVLESGKHPGELKDMVCSPAGTTIEAVRVLERSGFRSAVIEAMKACTEVSRNL
ncbi:MAG: pyrroline-5-carboxylate reductase [Lachnospiraceae bacterium]|nr:pyrroline-5-carboxylate reductase [Lachnospiraceae bacterium]